MNMLFNLALCENAVACKGNLDINFTAGGNAENVVL